MLMTISSFLVPTNSNGKLMTNGFSLIGSILYLLYFANTLPFHEVNVPIIGKFFINIIRLRMIWFYIQFCPRIYIGKSFHISVILFANHMALTGIAIFLNIICIKMVREDKSNPPPRLFKLIFSQKVSKVLCLSGFEVNIYYLITQIMKWVKLSNKQPIIISLNMSFTI